MKRVNVISRVRRQIPAESMVNTIFGYTTHDKFRCKCCGNIFLTGEAYLKSTSQRKHENDIRPFCVECWDRTNGRTKREPDYGTANLIAFLYYEIHEIHGDGTLIPFFLNHELQPTRSEI